MNEWWLLSSLGLLLIIALIFALYPLRKYKLSLMLFTPIIFILLIFAYLNFGSWFQYQKFIKQAKVTDQVNLMLKSTNGQQDLIERLKVKLKEDPKSAKGWFLLGRLYASLGRYDEAKEAYFKAYKLNPKDTKIIVNYALSLWELNQHKFNSEIRDLLKIAYKKNQREPDVLAMLAMDAYLGKDYKKAISYWEKLLAVLPNDSEESMGIRKAIANANKKI